MASRSGAPQAVTVSRLRLHPHSSGAGDARWFFISRLTAISASRCCTLLLVEFWANAGRVGLLNGGFRRANDFEVVRARDRSRMLEYGVAKTRV
jgi:hypothetical protein